MRRCITYHVLQCAEQGVTRDEFLETFNVGLVVGGSIVIPHLRRAFERMEEALESASSKRKEREVVLSRSPRGFTSRTQSGRVAAD